MKSKQYTLSVLTLGCRVNQYESDAITCELQKNGVVLVPFGEKCDASLINTCTVTAESDRKSRQMIRRASHNTKNVIVTGCFAQISPDEAAEVDGVVYVCGNKDKSSLVDVIMKILEGTYVGEKNAVRSFDNNNTCTMTLEKPMRSRSYIKIEDGCANHCSYCIISSARGPVCSKPIENVISEAQTLASKGCREVILTGIETASYGMDFSQKKPYGYALADLVEKVNEIDGIERIGLGSLDPSVMNDYFVDKISKTKKALPHFHLSVQSGSSAVLARMRRKYNRDMLLRAIERMKNAIPDATFSADIIVGFPGESEKDFMETVKFCDEVSFLHLHIFPYSKRAGTEAASMTNQISADICRFRKTYLDNFGKEKKASFLREYVNAHTSSPVWVLVEKNINGKANGHSEHFVEIFFQSKTAKVGDIVPVKLKQTDKEVCFGET